MSHSIPTDLLQKLLNYLVTKAYSEVNALISEVQTKAALIPVEPPVEPTAPVAPAQSQPVKK